MFQLKMVKSDNYKNSSKQNNILLILSIYVKYFTLSTVNVGHDQD